MDTKETMLLLPRSNFPLNLHNDVSGYQLGGVVSQYQKKVVLFTSKLTGTKKRYTTTKKKLLNIMETIR